MLPGEKFYMMDFLGQLDKSYRMNHRSRFRVIRVALLGQDFSDQAEAFRLARV